MRRSVFAVVAVLAATALPATPAHATPSCPSKVVFVGDSITGLLGDFPRIRELLTQAGCGSTQLYNAGIDGRTTGDVTVAAPFLIHAIRPDVVIYMIGTNDGVDGFEARYAGSLQTMRDWGGAGLKIITSINQCPLTPPAPTIYMQSKNNAVYRQSVDMTTWLLRPNIVALLPNDRIPSSLMGPDGYHPTVEAQGYIQEYMYNGLASAYGLTPTPVNPRATGGTCT